jgi:hypothetical protein
MDQANRGGRVGKCMSLLPLAPFHAIIQHAAVKVSRFLPIPYLGAVIQSRFSDNPIFTSSVLLIRYDNLTCAGVFSSGAILAYV